MKRCVFFALIGMLGISVGYIPVLRAETITIAYLQDGLSDLQKTEKQVALKLWVEELPHKGDYAVKILPVATMARLEALIKARTVNYAILNAVHYLKRHDQLKDYFERNFMAIQRSTSLYEEYLVVTHGHKNINKFNQLIDKHLSIGKDNPLMNFYLEYLVLKSGHPSPDHFFKKIKATSTASQAVLDIYFGNSDACIVPKHILDRAVALNPSIMDRLRIIHRSGANFIPVLVVGAKYNPASVKSGFSQSIESLQGAPGKQQIIDLFNIQAAVMIGPEKLTAMNSIYSEYQRLAGSKQ